MFQSQCLLLRKGPLGAIWVAAYCFKKLKKSQVMETDISFSADKILQDELNIVTYRVMAYLLLGLVRIYAKKVEYLHVDCDKVLTEVNEFAVSAKDIMRKETLQAHFNAIVIPSRFELDAFDLGILEDVTGSNMVSHEEITLKDHKWQNEVMLLLDENHGDEITEVDDVYCCDNSLFEDVFSSHVKHIEWGASTSHDQVISENFQVSTISCEKIEDTGSNRIESASLNPVELFGEDYQSHEEILKEEMGQHKDIIPEASTEMALTATVCCEEDAIIEIASGGGKEYTEQEKSSDEEYPRSTEKLRDNTDAYVDSMGINMSFGAKNGTPELAGMDSERHGFTSLEMESPERRNHDDIRNEQLSISLDGISYSKSPDFTGTKTPEFMVVPTPATKERRRISRKRKCIVDDIIVLSNGELKQSINNARDLVVKRRKCPNTSLNAWKATQISSLSSGFTVPLMSGISPELRSLFCEARVKRSADKMEIPQTLEAPNSSSPGLLDKTDHFEANSQARQLSTVPDVSRPITTERSEQVMNHIETLSETSVLERPSALEPHHLDGPETLAIAPGTPVRCSTSARSFRSLEESPKVPSLNTVRLCEVDDDLGSDGWSGKTRMVARYLLQNLTNQKVQRLGEGVNLSHLLIDKTRRQSATVFYEILVLKTKECVEVQQEYAYGDILVWKLPNWGLSFGTDLSITCEDCV